MAEMDIGKHCAFSTCNRLDFLPFTCALCGEIFCKEHKTPDQHNCTKNDSVEHTVYDGEKSFPCHVPDCHNRELTNICCESCSLTVCLSHRHQIDHQCVNLEVPTERMTKTKEHVQKIIDSKTQGNKKSGGKGRKSKVTAAKVALMKIKMKAAGDKSTPEGERIFLQVVLPSSAKQQQQPMFFSKKWTIGRIIDEMSKLSGIPNNNNVASAKKLRLFDDEHDEMFSCEVTLENMLEKEDCSIINGGTVVLDYVSC